MAKHAFVTGATGFLGVNLVLQLHTLGWKITAIHRNPITHPALKNVPINWKNVSLFDVDALRDAMPKDPFVVFHVAASTTQWKPEYAQQTRTNVEGTAAMLAAVKGSAITKFIYTSSITTYGLHKEIITEETTSTAAATKLNYAITKHQAELRVKKAVAEDGLNAVILNPCHIIGPWDTNNWIQLFDHTKNQTLPGIPPASGNFAWVEEVARAHIVAVEKGVSGENYILGGPMLSMLELIQETQRQLGLKISTKTTPEFLLKAIEPFYRLQSFFTKKAPTLTKDKVAFLLKSFEADDSKAQNILGYQHKTTAEIVRGTLAWMETR